MRKYNLTKYAAGEKVIIGKEDDGYPLLAATIIAKAPRMVQVELADDSCFGKPNIRWLSARLWWVVAKVPKI